MPNEVLRRVTTLSKGEMPTWEQAYPHARKFDCRHYWHLRKSGNLLALYDFLGSLTNGGKNPFIASVRKVAIYFYGSDDQYETVRRNFKTLHRMGWIRYEGEEIFYVSHADWAAANPGKCVKVDELPMPWDNGKADPLVGQIWAVAGGKIHLHDGVLKGIRKYTTDDDFLFEFRNAMAEGRAKRLEGIYHHTAPKQIFWNTFHFFKTTFESRTAQVIEKSQAPR
jgi:hypothetical protein